MRPLETHLEMSSHLWMYNRLREMLVHEGMIADDADDEQVRQAVSNWLDMIAIHERERITH